MPPTSIQLSSIPITSQKLDIQDINTMVVTTTVLPGDVAASEQALADASDAAVAVSTTKIATLTAAIQSRLDANDQNQADIVAEQAKIDEANTDKAIHLANIATIAQVFPIDTLPVTPAGN